MRATSPGCRHRRGGAPVVALSSVVVAVELIRRTRERHDVLGLTRVQVGNRS